DNSMVAARGHQRNGHAHNKPRCHVPFVAVAGSGQHANHRTQVSATHHGGQLSIPRGNAAAYRLTNRADRRGGPDQRQPVPASTSTPAEVHWPRVGALSGMSTVPAAVSGALVDCTQKVSPTAVSTR